MKEGIFDKIIPDPEYKYNEISENDENIKLCDFCYSRRATTYIKSMDKWCCGYLPSRCPSRIFFCSDKKPEPGQIEENGVIFYPNDDNELCDHCQEKKGVYFKGGFWSCDKVPGKCLKSRKTNDYKLIKQLVGHSLFCDYGCGKIAKYINFTFGSVCCSKFHKECETYSKKVRNMKKEKYYKECNEGLHKTLPNNLCLCGCGEYTKSYKSKWVRGHHAKGKPSWNAGKKRPDHSKKLLERAHHFRGKHNLPMHKARRYTIETIKEKYPLFSKLEEMRYEKGSDYKIQVHCKNNKCKNSKENGGWFTPSKHYFSLRIRMIEKFDSDSFYFYCSEECKKECSLFNINSDILARSYFKENKESWYTQEEYITWRKEVFSRANYICEICGEPAENAHHIKPRKLEPFFSLDPDYGLALCKKCHYERAHIDECSTRSLAYKKC